MTSAPGDLLEVQRYAHDQTGQPWASLGIIHATPQGGGYHEGEDLLIAAGTAPGPQYPGSDYSYTDAPGRDLLPTGRLAGGNYASAFDFGGDFDRFLEFNAWMRSRMLLNDPRTHDIREMIYTLDGRTVRRIDRAGVQGDSGDSSHLGHTHFSFFRDSLGKRARSDNFLGLLKEFFQGAPKEDDMSFEDGDRELLVRLNHGVDGLLGNLPKLQPGSSWGTKANEVHNQLKSIGSRLESLEERVGEPVPVAMSAEDRAAIVADLRAGLVAEIATAVADENARRQQA